MRKKGLPFWLSFIIMTAFWVIIGIFIFRSTGDVRTFYVILLFFALTTISMILRYRAQWKGKIIEIKTELVNSDDDYGGRSRVNYAYIGLEGGKRKKIKSQRNWVVGDKLEKVRGESNVKKID